MEVLYPRCAGLDVHKDSVMACVRCVSRPAHQEVRQFATTTAGLLALGDWLASHGCTHVAMEATGVYWKPVWHLLEGHFELVLANAQHVRNVPGRKTDVHDAMWLADLLAHGLIRSSFVPPAPIQALRDLTRTRKQLVREISQHSLRIQKTLEDANIKVASVLSNILGGSGRAMLAALIAGEADPERLADLAQGTARKKRPELIEALRCLQIQPLGLRFVQRPGHCGTNEHDPVDLRPCRCQPLEMLAGGLPFAGAARHFVVAPIGLVHGGLRRDCIRARLD